MRKNILSVVAIIFSIIAIVISLIALLKVDEMKPVHSTNSDTASSSSSASTPSQEEQTQDTVALNEQYRNATSIGYCEDLEIYHDYLYGPVYGLNYDEGSETCRFGYSLPDTGESYNCEFSKDVYFRVLNTVLATELKELPIPLDENGKVVEKRVKDCITIYVGGKQHYFDEIDNKDEIIRIFLELRDSAME